MRGRFAIWGVVLIWAANFSIIKAALADFHPLAFNALRFPIASLVLVGLWQVPRRKAAAGFTRREWAALAGLGILGHVAYQPLFIFGLDRTLAGNSSLLLATVPVWVAIFSVVLGHERLPARTWIGVGLSLTGIGLVVMGGRQSVRFGGGTMTGDLLTLAAAVLWSGYTVGSAPLVRRHGALPVTAITTWIGSAGLVLVGLPSLAAQDWAAVRPAAWAGLVYAGALGLGVAYALWYISVRAIGSTRSAVTSNAIPILALAIAWLTLGEQPTWLQLSGAAAILAGITLAGTGRRGRRARRSPS